MSGHQFGRWSYSRTRKLWRRRCIVGQGMCTATESVPPGHKPKEQR